jgi:hypothetical protein
MAQVRMVLKDGMAKARTNLETVQDVKVSPTRQIISSSKKLWRTDAVVSDIFLKLALFSVKIPLKGSDR